MTVARKEHTCDICLHPITPGTDYLAQRVTPWDYDSDSFYTWRCHWCCARLGFTYLRDLHEGSYTVDALTDWAGQQRSIAAHVDPHDVGPDCWAHRTLPTQHGIRLWLRPLPWEPQP